MSGDLALLRVFCQCKIEHQACTILSFSIFSCNHRRSQEGHAPSKYLEYVVILCFGRQCLKQIADACNQIICTQKKYWADYVSAYNHFHTEGLHLSHAQPFTSV